MISHENHVESAFEFMGLLPNPKDNAAAPDGALPRWMKACQLHSSSALPCRTEALKRVTLININNFNDFS
jgi:hypothetical protein